MSERDGKSLTESAYCMGCGYALRGLEENRCPECGRGFDPADVRTMSMGAPLRRWQRMLLKPIGWPTAVLAVVGTAGLGYLSGWPGVRPIPWSVLIGEFRWPDAMLRPLTWMDLVFYGSVLVWMALIVIAILRRMLRLLVPRQARRVNSTAGSGRIRRIVTVCLLLTGVLLGLGWRHRIARRWMARVLTVEARGQGRWAGSWGYDGPWYRCPVSLSPEEESALLHDCLENGSTARERTAALAILVQDCGKSLLPELVKAVGSEKDRELRIWELRLIALCRDPSTASLLISYLDDADPAMRAAAADAVGILRKPGYSIEVPKDFWVIERLSLDSRPPIDVREIVSPPTLPPNTTYTFGRHDEHDLAKEAPIAVDPAVRGKLLKMMLHGQTQDEREAAARALVNWPPEKYRFRLAEWGVWINNNGHLALAKSVVDEIPPFVHRTGNPLSSFGSYFLYPSIVTKPIIHLTSDTALAADVEVRIRLGRPWFAYPRPDDFGIGVGGEPDRRRKPLGNADDASWRGTAITQPSDFDNGSLGVLSNCREGYPWLLPRHRAYTSDSTGFGGRPLAVIYSLGVRWQSVIVSPERLEWMVTPMVPGDAKFAWWSRLRQVPSSWVCNRGETERFLYYDGPTRAPTPAGIQLVDGGRAIQFTRPGEVDPEWARPRERNPRPEFHAMPGALKGGTAAYEGIYIEVRGGAVSGHYLRIEHLSGKYEFRQAAALQGAEVRGKVREVLISYGLTAQEADGLVEAWAPQWLGAEGRRFLLRISPEDYAQLCPMQIRPALTEAVRLGIILTEFDGGTAIVPEANRGNARQGNER